MLREFKSMIGNWVRSRLVGKFKKNMFLLSLNMLDILRNSLIYILIVVRKYKFYR